MAWTTPGTATAGEVLTASFWNTNVRDNTNELYGSMRRLAYQTRSTSYAVDQTAVASAADMFSSDLTFTADGTSAYLFEFYCAFIYTGNGAGQSIRAHLVNGSGTDLGRVFLSGEGDGSRRDYSTCFVRFYYTPSAGSVSFNMRGVYATGFTGGAAFDFGGGGAGANLPGHMAIYGPAIT